MKKEIAKDIERTFSTHPFFSSQTNGTNGSKALHNVLMAYSAFNTKVGYCQGMNFVAGFILLMSGGNEEETFYFLVALLKTQDGPPIMDGLRGLYKNCFPLLHKYTSYFDEQFSTHLPRVSSKFNTLQIPTLLWLTKWIQTLFLYSFPFGVCIRLWDMLLSEGTQFVFAFILSLLEHLQEKFLHCEDLMQVNGIFKELEEMTFQN